MAEIDEVLTEFLPDLIVAERALRNGDRSTRPAMWSHEDPVTFFGAAVTHSGWDDIAPAFDALASQFSNCRSFEYEIIAAGASGDLAYLVGYEHTITGVAGAPEEKYSLRVTTILRREDGTWKVIHRHGDPLTDSDTAREQVLRMKRQLS